MKPEILYVFWCSVTSNCKKRNSHKKVHQYTSFCDSNTTADQSYTRIRARDQLSKQLRGYIVVYKFEIAYVV